MTVLDIETIEKIEINDETIDEDKICHLYTNETKEYTICGIHCSQDKHLNICKEEHHLFIFYFPDNTSCPVCGAPLCDYCKFLEAI